MGENLKRLERKFALIGEENGYDINFFNPKIIPGRSNLQFYFAKILVSR
jgi:hypothetical protein